MKANELRFSSNRRSFLTKQLPVGALMCLGCKSLLSSPVLSSNQQETVSKAKYLADSGMNVEEVFKFTFNYCVPIYKKLGEKIGSEKLLKLLTEVSGENFGEFIQSATKDKPRDMKTLAEFIKEYQATPPYDKALTCEITEATDKVLEAKYTECLIAKLYREMNAADIGFAIECAPSDMLVRAFNPRMRVKSIKNLMKGDDVCIERIYLET